MEQRPIPSDIYKEIFHLNRRTINSSLFIQLAQYLHQVALLKFLRTCIVGEKMIINFLQLLLFVHLIAAFPAKNDKETKPPEEEDDDND